MALTIASVQPLVVMIKRGTYSPWPRIHPSLCCSFDRALLNPRRQDADSLTSAPIAPEGLRAPSPLTLPCLARWFRFAGNLWVSRHLVKELAFLFTCVATQGRLSLPGDGLLYRPSEQGVFPPVIMILIFTPSIMTSFGWLAHSEEKERLFK